MTLEHISIVINGGMFVIDSLSKEKQVEKEIRIEDVKPIKNDENEEKVFMETTDKYLSYSNNHSKKISRMKKSHPWFIALNNKQWHFLFIFIH